MSTSSWFGCDEDEVVQYRINYDESIQIATYMDDATRLSFEVFNVRQRNWTTRTWPADAVLTQDGVTVLIENDMATLDPEKEYVLQYACLELKVYNILSLKKRTLLPTEWKIEKLEARA